MKITHPLETTSRNLPGVRISGVELSISMGDADDDGNTRIFYSFDFPDGYIYEGRNLYVPSNSRTYAQAISTLLGYLNAAAQAFVESRTSSEFCFSEYNIFDTRIVRWAAHHLEEIEVLHAEIRELYHL